MQDIENSTRSGKTATRAFNGGNVQLKFKARDERRYLAAWYRASPCMEGKRGQSQKLL